MCVPQHEGPKMERGIAATPSPIPPFNFLIEPQLRSVHGPNPA